MKRLGAVLLTAVGLAVLLIGIGSLSYYYLKPVDDTLTRQRPVTESPPDEIGHLVESFTRHDTPANSTSEASPGARVAIVIDDLGWETRTAPLYDRIGANLTMAVLPGRPHSQSMYDRWKHQFEFIVHMPMEPKGYPEDDPGEQALMTSMEPADVQEQLRSAIEQYPRVVGINNHMGSAFTRNEHLMGTVMQTLADREMYYLDSGTTRGSTSLDMAQKWGVPALKNEIFLDHRRKRDFVEQQLQKLVERARDNGYAVGIGHVQSEITARVLVEEIPRYQEQGVNFVPLSEVMGVPRLSASSRE